MKLNVYIGDFTTQVDVPDDMLADATDIFAKMNADMDKGWQMSQVWVDKLDNKQRCQAVADKLLTAIETENESMTMLMAGYIMTTMPGIKAIHISTDGDMTQTELDQKNNFHKS